MSGKPTNNTGKLVFLRSDVRAVVELLHAHERINDPVDARVIYARELLDNALALSEPEFESLKEASCKPPV